MRIGRAERITDGAGWNESNFERQLKEDVKKRG